MTGLLILELILELHPSGAREDFSRQRLTQPWALFTVAALHPQDAERV